MHDGLTGGGMVSTVYQPRMQNPTRQHAIDMAEKIEVAMKEVGFTQIARHELDLEPAPAICVTGVKSDERAP
jgi:hypothetical protein